MTQYRSTYQRSVWISITYTREKRERRKGRSEAEEGWDREGEEGSRVPGKRARAVAAATGGEEREASGKLGLRGITGGGGSSTD